MGPFTLRPGLGYSGALYTAARAGPVLGLARAGRWMLHLRLDQTGISRHYRCKRVICQLYFQTKALCSRQQMTHFHVVGMLKFMSLT